MPLNHKNLREAQKLALPLLSEGYRMTAFSILQQGCMYVMRHSNNNKIVVTAQNGHVAMYKNNKLIKDVKMR